MHLAELELLVLEDAMVDEVRDLLPVCGDHVHLVVDELLRGKEVGVGVDPQAFS